MINIYKDIEKKQLIKFIGCDTNNLVSQTAIQTTKLIIQYIQTEYDKLCPKPSEFGFRNATSCKYTSYSTIKFNNETEDWHKRYYLDEAIPLGIDIRLCRWSIQDAKRIHGEQE